MHRTFTFLLLLSLLISACGQKEKLQGPQKPEGPKPGEQTNVPPPTWKEHWFEHQQLVKCIYYNDQVAVYYDDDTPKSISWPIRKANDAWKYVKKTYGSFGTDPRLFVILHTGKYGGGHPSTYFDDSHDYRNVIDLGNDKGWVDSTHWNLDAYIHEIGHIVEGASYGVKGSPAFDIWHDSKWMEIFNYDVYLNLGWNSDAARFAAECTNNVDKYPREGTQWFKNWFFPIYRDYGKTVVLQRFFQLLSVHFPKKDISLGKEYTRKMNYGEFIHFWSGAAKTDLTQIALKAFGEKDENGNKWADQLEAAKKDFPGIKY